MNAPHKDPVGARMGMWLFLFTELLLFGGLFVLYSAYLHRYPLEFHHAAKELSRVFGTANTAVLLISSFCVAASVSALRYGKVVLARRLILLTMALALVFLVNKFFEWSIKFEHGLYPGGHELAERELGQQVFFALYFAMTGLHGLHVVIGMSVLGWVYSLTGKKILPGEPVALENAGLYWHLVDLIWIYLFPLFYLVT
ncbi:cytochrome c oxidase subunit 3 [Paucidesulfovibrio longus]|uniref:cytochrome c oxidase subunit 3 n=1 Tax=Paucidesulfovibrio longus TaxID=889 RepID=UPI0003B6B18D|nr:cytochrome c oxidase subunit 3 [Paucidesulfovibrio longus]